MKYSYCEGRDNDSRVETVTEQNKKNEFLNNVSAVAGSEAATMDKKFRHVTEPSKTEKPQ